MSSKLAPLQMRLGKKSVTSPFWGRCFPATFSAPRGALSSPGTGEAGFSSALGSRLPRFSFVSGFSSRSFSTSLSGSKLTALPAACAAATLDLCFECDLARVFVTGSCSLWGVAGVVVFRRFVSCVSSSALFPSFGCGVEFVGSNVVCLFLGSSSVISSFTGGLPVLGGAQIPT